MYVSCRHLEIFELVRVEDERELAARLDTVRIYNTPIAPIAPTYILSLSPPFSLLTLQVHVDSNSLKSMIELLHRKTVHTVAHANLLSVIYHCILLPSERLHTS